MVHHHSVISLGSTHGTVCSLESRNGCGCRPEEAGVIARFLLVGRILHLSDLGTLAFISGVYFGAHPSVITTCLTIYAFIDYSKFLGNEIGVQTLGRPHENGGHTSSRIGSLAPRLQSRSLEPRMAFKWARLPLPVWFHFFLDAI